MPLFGALSAGDAARLVRDNQRLALENADLKRVAERASLRADRAEAARRRAEDDKAPPVEFGEVLTELKAFVPTLPYAPGYSVLATARDAKSFAQGVNLMLQHARLVGQLDGKAASL